MLLMDYLEIDSDFSSYFLDLSSNTSKKQDIIKHNIDCNNRYVTVVVSDSDVNFLGKE